ncbi:GNAT family N-acetyltransferase [Flavobacteriaceae bacterium S356]|uniref:GNAT family N-acetyltransferase n=1 Tax=Asprobacillus argus TaxID=3076534 RepID=A0ABU3LCB5_9FLAO|nr:GNAT family N-acetyltransferase [Flavobacteriaceae bacterium S356]
MRFIVKRFTELSTDELYAILQLRSEVFVVEQDCVYQDIDYKDQKAFHVIGIKENAVVAYARIFDAGDYFELPSIGRILVKEDQRAFKYGHQLVQEAIFYIENHFKNTSILISAQTYLLKFYNNLGFVQQGEEYLEDGIPHIKMFKG